jgi:4'-phosphopantetheinyl transferase
VGIPPRQWRFAASSHGRPEIVRSRGIPAIRFNVSHTRGLVACAVTLEVDVGIDVENIHGAPPPVGVAERFFAPAEVAVLRGLRGSEQAAKFYEYWTLKESYIKALGVGLSMPLDRVWFHVADGRQAITASFDTRMREDPRCWQFCLFRPTDDHVVALSVRRRPGRHVGVEVREALALIDPGGEPLTASDPAAQLADERPPAAGRCGSSSRDRRTIGRHCTRRNPAEGCT